MPIRTPPRAINAATKRSGGKSSPKSEVRVQAVEGYVLYCLTYIRTMATAERIVGSAGFSLTKYRILGFATLLPGVTVGELVTRLRISHQAAHAPLRQLLKEGYVVAKTRVEDRRHKHLFATPKGSRLYRRILSANVDRVEKAFHAAGPKAVRGFLEIHKRMVEPADREWAERASRFVE